MLALVTVTLFSCRMDLFGLNRRWFFEMILGPQEPFMNRWYSYAWPFQSEKQGTFSWITFKRKKCFLALLASMKNN